MGQVNVNSPERSGSGGTAAMAVVIALLALVVVGAVFFFGPGRTTVVNQPAPQAPAPNINVQPPAAPNINVQPPNVNVNPPAQQAPQR
jgi:hypothetical protein